VSKRRLVDTNLIVRYLVQDHEKHAKAAGKLFDACDRGDVVIVVLPAVLAECVFVLESFYEHPRGDIASALGRLISSPVLKLMRRSTWTLWIAIEKQRSISWTA
jgi:predicted nucleic acid-binding protein